MAQSHKKTVLEALGRRPIHPFPARMAPGIALDALGSERAPVRVLDPMSGSGTVLAVAAKYGHAAFGIDIDPLAVLMARVWTTPVERSKITLRASEVLKRAKVQFKRVPAGGAYPSSADEETRRFIRYWFDCYARRQLCSLAQAIEEVDEKTTRELLWCAFSRLIIAKSVGASLAMDLAHSRPHKVYDKAPAKPFARFLAAVETVVANCPEIGTAQETGTCSVAIGDARQIHLEDESIDLVVTSPPYLNAIDYIRCSKFSLVWMGHTIEGLRAIRAGSVGTEASREECRSCDWVAAVIRELKLRPKLSNRTYGLLAQYVWDMRLSIREVARVLKPGGRAVYVVGDSMVRGTFIKNSKIVSSIAVREGMIEQSRYSRALPTNRRYMPPPKQGQRIESMDTRMRREIVLVFSSGKK